jgi:hypothetical protein
MGGKIYLIQQDDTLQDLSEEPYASEDLLQALLEKYPDLLAGDQIDEVVPRRWLLVSREMDVPGEEDGTGRWSLDHLFLDQDATPTLVEVKRSTDTRIRREVVGQMLDYAANAVVYWPVETIRARFEAACDGRGDEPDLLVAELIQAAFEDDTPIETFWKQVKTNLQAGRVRLVFVADEIPLELRRIVEFLNEQMDPAEVLAVEIKQFVGQGLKTLVPKVIGQTAGSDKKKPGRTSERRKWDESSFFEKLEARKGAEAADVAKKILEWARSRVTRIWWGEGSRNGSFVSVLNHKGKDHQLFAVWTYGTVEIYFYWYQYKAPFDSEEKRRELLRRFNAIEGIQLPDDAIAKRPSLPLSALADEARLAQGLDIFDWVVQEIQST